MKKAVIGVDVGADGSIALITADEVIFYDQGRDYLGAFNFLTKVFNEYDILLITIEDVRGINKTSRKSTFTFGYVKGKTDILFELLNKKLYRVTPLSWQKYYHIKIPQQYRRMSNYRKKQIRKQLIASMALAERPNIKPNIYTPRKRLLDGRTDALLIGLYGMKNKHLNIENINMKKDNLITATLATLASIQLQLAEAESNLKSLTEDSETPATPAKSEVDTDFTLEEVSSFLDEVTRDEMSREDMDFLAKDRLNLSYRSSLLDANLRTRVIEALTVLEDTLDQDGEPKLSDKEMKAYLKKKSKKLKKLQDKKDKKNLKEINEESPWKQDEDPDDKKKSKKSTKKLKKQKLKKQKLTKKEMKALKKQEKKSKKKSKK